MSKDSFTVFLSHAEEDYDLVFRVFNILFRLKASPYMHELYPNYRCDIPTGIRDVLRDCSICMTFLTKNGINSQWVQQELGIAYAFAKIIVPVIETRVEHKGFVQMVRRIQYNPGNPDLMIYDVIYAVRTHVLSHDEIPISLTCANHHEHDYLLPSTNDINKTIRLKSLLCFKCDTCGTNIYLSPQTLEIEKGPPKPLWWPYS